MKYTIEQRRWTDRNICGPSVVSEDKIVAGPYTPGTVVQLTTRQDGRTLVRRWHPNDQHLPGPYEGTVLE